MLTAAFCFCNASSNLHKTLLDAILKAKNIFFDIKPLGMILNRFSKDIDVIGKGNPFCVDLISSITVVCTPV